MVKYFTLLILIGISHHSVNAQNDKVPYVPPSPNAASLLEYASVPVNLYTGTPEISVPFFELKGRKLSVPISISYHGSGIKVQDNSSSVGLGWALNAGGVITRIVRGIADESPNGYFNSDFNSIMNDASRFATTDATDTEPDIFYYNFNGKTGRLVMDANKNSIQIPENNLKITVPNFSLADPVWEIIDTDGIKYVFGKTTNSRETTTSTLTYPVNPKTYISTWYLSEIVYPFNTETISFNYQQGSDVYFENYRQYLESTLSGVANCTPPFGFGATFGVQDIITKITINAPKYVSSITSSLGSVNLTYANDRSDILNALRLIQIVLKDLSSNEIKKISLSNNFYFISDDCNTSDCKRLKLDKLFETTGASSLLLRGFEYNGTNLPSRKTIKYDHWGYYNNNTYSSAIPQSKTYNGPGGPVTFGGADKSPYEQRTQANILTKIVNSAGGSQELYYQLNAYDLNGTVTPTGGIRVYKIIENDGTNINPPVEKNYKYVKTSDPSKSSGQIYRKNTYDYLISNQQYCQPGGGTYSYQHVVSYSTSLIDIFDIGGMHVGYSEVQIEYSNGGKEQLFFNNFSDHPDDPVTFLNDPDPDGPPFISKGDRSYERGLLKEQVFLNSLGKKVKRVLSNYDYYLASSLEAPGGRIMLLYTDGTASFTARRGTYKITHRGVRLLETIQETYDQLDDTKYVSSRSTFDYNSIYTNAIKNEINYLNDGLELKKLYKYPMDYFSSQPQYADVKADGIYELGKAHIIAPIETVTYLKNTISNGYEVIGANVLTFQRDVKPAGTMDVTRPEGIYKLNLTSPQATFNQSTIDVSGSTGTFNFGSGNSYKKIHTFSSFDDYSNLLAETLESGIDLQYVWSNNSSLVVSITKSPGTFQHVSNYSYRHLVGLQSATDPNTRNTNYEYDTNNRLKLIRDHDSNILSKFKYNYAGSLYNAVDFSYYMNEDNSYQFNLSGGAEPGSQYLWDFGNGTVRENGTSQNMSYAASGTYNVKLAATNPEYPTTSSQHSVTVLPAVTATITGYDYTINICGGPGKTSQVINASVSGSYDYQWQYRRSGYETTWHGTGSNSASITYAVTGVNGSSNEIRCRITDANGNTKYSNLVYISYYCQYSDGTSPPGPSTCPAGYTWNAALGDCVQPCTASTQCGPTGGVWNTTTHSCNCY